MIVSTRGRYAIRLLLDLAERGKDSGFVPMKEIAERESISVKYMEQIMPLLVKGGFVEGAHGKGGGYRLAVDPTSCRVGDVLRVTEGDLAPVACLSCNAEPCQRAASCRTIGMWTEFNRLTNEYFDAITLADLLNS